MTHAKSELKDQHIPRPISWLLYYGMNLYKENERRKLGLTIIGCRDATLYFNLGASITRAFVESGFSSIVIPKFRTYSDWPYRRY